MVVTGSMDSEAGVFAMTFDHSGSRLITCDADKTIKIYKEDDTAVSNHIFFVILSTERKNIIGEHIVVIIWCYQLEEETLENTFMLQLNAIIL